MRSGEGGSREREVEVVRKTGDAARDGIEGQREGRLTEWCKGGTDASRES